MDSSLAEMKAKKMALSLPSSSIENEAIVISGRWLRIAAVHDEEWHEGVVVDAPDELTSGINAENVKADIFTFAQKIPETRPKYQYYMEWDNVAAIPTTSYDDWWERRLPQVTRKSVRRGIKRGVIAEVVDFNDDLVQGIVEIHNETPVKQGRPFSHFGKSFEMVKKGYGTYLETADFLGAYYKKELIGIIKLVWIGKLASIMEIVSKERHYDKRPMNVLIAKAVEVCVNKGAAYLLYGKFVYGKKTNSSLTEFKRRNGFEQIDLPRYFIPLTVKGKIAIKLKLHRGLLGVLPSKAISLLRDSRSRYYELKLRLANSGGKQHSRKEDEYSPGGK
jgi:hypothetical protein